jgi:hypothetical protein
MSEESVIDDLASRRDLGVLCEWAREGRPIPLRRVQVLVNGSANTSDVLRYGPGWLAALLDLAERGGVGTLERGADGAVVFRPAAEVPNFEDAWRQAIKAWDEP